MGRQKPPRMPWGRGLLGPSVPACADGFRFPQMYTFGMDSSSKLNLTSMCSLTEGAMKDNFQEYLQNLNQHNALLEMFEPVQYDIRSRLSRTKDSEPCNRLLLSNANKSGVGEIFLSNQFSFSSTVGALEPLIPPLRHPKYCQNRKMLMDLSYLVHDFHTMCKNLKPTSQGTRTCTCST